MKTKKQKNVFLCPKEGFVQTTCMYGAGLGGFKRGLHLVVLVGRFFYCFFVFVNSWLHPTPICKQTGLGFVQTTYVCKTSEKLPC